MSNKIFEKVAFDDSFKTNDDFVKVVMGYAIPHAVDDMGSYWRTEEAEKIILSENKKNLPIEKDNKKPSISSKSSKKKIKKKKKINK